MVIFIQFRAFTQVNILNIRSEYYSIHNGLNSPEVFGIAESDDGFIWLATNNGVVRYDAHSFRSFNHNLEDTTTISNNYIKKICPDKHGRLWLVSGDHLDIFDTRTLKVQRISNKEVGSKGKYIPFNFAYDSINDEMWISTEKGLYINKGKEINIRKKPLPKGLELKLANCNMLIEDHTIWLCTAYGLCKWNRTNDLFKIYHHPDLKNTKEGDGFLNIYKDNKGIIWIGNWTLGMLSFDPESEHMDTYIYGPSNGQNCVYFTQDLDAKIYPGLLLVGTMHGLKLFDKKARKWITPETINFNIKDLNPNYSALASARSGYWIGTSLGLSRLNLNSRFLNSIPLGLGGLSAAVEINDLFFEANSRGIDSIVWFTASYYKLFKYDLVNKRELPLPPKLFPYGQAKKGLYDFHMDKKSILWLTSQKDTFVGYDIKKDNIVKPVFTSKNPLALCIAQDSNSDLWFGTFNGLFYYNKTKNRFIQNDEVNKALSKYKFSKKLLRIEVDKNDNIWLASGWQDANKGIVFYNPTTHVVKLYNVNKNNALLSLDQIECIKSVGDELFVSGFDGLVRCRFNSNGLIDQQIVSNKFSWKSKDLREGQIIGNNQLWYITKYGILNYNLGSEQIMDFNHVNSNIGVDITGLSYSEQSRRIYIPRINQLDYFEVDSVNKFIPAKVKLCDIFIANYDLKEFPHQGKTLVLKSHQNSLQLEFSNFSFNNSIENGYFYKIKHDHKWKKMNGNVLSFDGLGKGDYFLEVVSTNCYGTMNKEPFLLHISILPPFYQTLWFIGLCILSMCLLMYYLYRVKIEELERLQKVRLSIARDLHDDMGSNLSHIKLLSEAEAMSNPDQPAFNTIVNKMAEVMNNMSEIIWNANPKNDKIEDVMYRIQEYAISTLEPLGIEIKSNFDELKTEIILDIEQKRHFYLIFKEAINNIGKYAKATMVTLSEESIGRTIAISINDNGVGFDPQLIKRGNGLVNMQERAKFLNGELKISTGEFGTKITLHMHGL